MNWDSIRSEFAGLSRWTFLNTATFGQMPRCASEATIGHLKHRDELACADFLDWFDDMDRVRESVAKLICCSADDIAFITNAATGLALLLSGLDWRRGDRIVTFEDEFPNNLYAPTALDQRGVEFVESKWECAAEAINERTRVVAVSATNYNTGFVPPFETLRHLCTQQGAILFVDGTQSVGGLRFDVKRIEPDILAVHGYKWLLSPNGAGFLYVSPGLRERLAPSVIGWRSHHDWRNVDDLHHGAPVFPTKAEKYEGGMLSFALLYAMGASIDMMLGIGPDKIEDRVLELAGHVRSVLQKCGAAVSDYSSPIVAAHFSGVDVSALAKELEARRVLVSARKGSLRVSPHFYNNHSDIEQLAEQLRAIIGIGVSR